MPHHLLTKAAVLTFVAFGLSACSISPKPLTFAQLQDISDKNTARVDAEQEPVRGPISLYEAMARAVKYNLDHRVEIMQTQLRSTELRLAHFSMLPTAVANSGYSARDSYLSTGERNIQTGVVQPPRTTSAEKSSTVSDLTFSWNILDFGLSYVRARQAADKVLIAEEAKRKVMHRIIENVRTAYWRTVSSERMVRRLQQLEGRAAVALQNSRMISDGRLVSPVASLTYQRELVEIKRTAQKLKNELSVAKSQLGALMNLRPGTEFTVIGKGLNSGSPLLNLPASEMVSTALVNRAELRDVAYQQRINEKEARAALLELLPGIQIYAGTNRDTNEYLAHKEWVNWGAKASWNVVKVFQYPAKRGVIRAQDKLLDARALALTMAVMTQVHVSRIRYHNMRRELRVAKELLGIQSRLLRQMRREAAADRISEQTLIREELNALVAEVKRDIAFAASQNAFATVFASMGLDPYAAEVTSEMSVHELAQQIRNLWFERGDFGARSKIKIASR